MNRSGRNAHSLGISILLTSLLTSAPAWAQAFSAARAYNFSSQFRGAGMCLDVYNGGPRNNRVHLTPCEGLSGQGWLMTRAGAAAGSYRLTTQFRGPDMCLAVIEKGPGADRLTLAKCADTPSQFWTLRSMGGATKLMSSFKGGRCVDVINGGAEDNDLIYDACANTSGQAWTMRDARAPTAKPAAPAARLVLDAALKKTLLALPKSRDIIITSGDVEPEQTFASDIYKFLKANGYDLDAPDRLRLTSIAQSTIALNAKTPKEPIQIRVGRTASFTQSP